LFLGIVFLLQALDILPWALWVNLWRFWPVVIIIIGLNILLRRQNVFLVGALILVLLGASLGIAIWQYDEASNTGIKSYSVPLDGLARARVELDFDGGSLSIGNLVHGSSKLVNVEADVHEKGKGIEADFQRLDSEGRLYLSTEDVGRVFWGGPWIDWDVDLTGEIPLEINIQSSASNLSIELDKLLITELSLSINAGNCKVTAPSSAGTTHMNIDANAANVEVIIPAGAAARVQPETNLSDFGVDESRFHKEGDYYVTDDFGSNENQIELKIKCNVGRVHVK
jgi:hypothetical protein